MTYPDSQWRHKLPADAESTEKLLYHLPEGQGVSIYKAMFWDVVARRKPGTKTVIEYIIVESHLGVKPWRVEGMGPYKTKYEAIRELRQLIYLFLTLKGSFTEAEEWA